MSQRFNALLLLINGNFTTIQRVFDWSCDDPNEVGPTWMNLLESSTNKDILTLGTFNHLSYYILEYLVYHTIIDRNTLGINFNYLIVYILLNAIKSIKSINL